MDTDVIVVGAGPVGLTLATEIALTGVRVIVVEQATQRSDQSKAMTLQPRTAEMLELRGLLSRAEDHYIGRLTEAHFAGIPLSLTGLGTRYSYQQGILQANIEDLLEKRLAELGGELRRGWQLTNLTQNDAGVNAHGPDTLTARYLVACDGGRSTVRKLLHVAFPGTEAKHFTTVADIVLLPGTSQPPQGWTTMGQTRRRGPNGTFASIVSIGQKGLYRFVYSDGRTDRSPVTTTEVADQLRAFYTDEYELQEVRHVSRFGDATRQADTYRIDRVFLAGDAAHIHPPIGGQGLNLGVQDAFNLGWKLAAVTSGRLPETLLDTYQTERHPVGAGVVDNTRAQKALFTPDVEHQALRKILTRLAETTQVNQALAALITGIGIDYGGPGPVGTRLPDIPIGHGWASELFHSGYGVLLTTDSRHLTQADPWADHVTTALVDELPWPNTDAVLVRPDGYICWTAPGDHPLTDALTTWFGAPPQLPHNQHSGG